MNKLQTLILMLLPIMAMLTGCEDKNEPSITRKDYKMSAGETAVVQGKGLSNVKWKAYDTFIADVVKGGKIEAHKVGWTFITSPDVSGSLEVLVSPKIRRYSEPIIDYCSEWIYYSEWTKGHLEVDYKALHQSGSAYLWGHHIGIIKQYVNKSGVPWKVKAQMYDVLTYETGNSETPFIGYVYDEKGYVYASCIYLDVRYANYLADFLGERFVIYSVDTNKYTADFARARIIDGKTKIDYIGRVSTSSTPGIIMILYVGVTEETKSRADLDSIDFDNIFHKFDEAYGKATTLP